MVQLLSCSSKQGISGQEQPRNLHLENALDKLESHGSSATYIALLRQCSHEKALSAGRLVHKQIVQGGLDRDRFLGNLLVQMYGRCGSLENARMVFDNMPERNLFSWSIMLSAYAQNGHGESALELYREMNRLSMKLDKVTYVSVLSACSSAGNLAEGRAVHARILASNLHLDVFLGTALINMYGKCRRLDEAWSVFDGAPTKSVVMWNAMIAAYAQNGHSREAVELYHIMETSGMQPSEVTLVCVLDACSDMAALEEGKRVHARICASEFQLVGSLGNALVNMYGKCGRIDEAKSMFVTMQPKNVVSWTTMISAYAQNGYNREALELFHEMDLKPNTVTFVNVLQACANLGSLEEGRAMHARAASSGFDTDAAVGTGLVDMYGKCLDLDEAKAAFDGIKLKNVVTWNALITAYAQNGCCRKARELFQKMELEGLKPDGVAFVGILGACCSNGDLSEGRQIHVRVVDSGFEEDVIVATALVSMYGKCRKLDDARKAFDKINGRSVVSWNAMMSSYVDNRDGKAALELLGMMISSQGMKPNELTLISALEACSCLGDLEAGRATHEKAIAIHLDLELVVANALITMYGKCGSLDDAKNVFENIPCRNVVSWNALIAAYTQTGHHDRDALKLYWQLFPEGIKPDEATFLTTLTACSSLGALAEGKAIHGHIMLSGLHTDVVKSALVNMYGKCGSLDAAMAVFNRMRRKDAVTWTAVIASHARHGHGPEALGLFREMELEGVMPDEVTLGCVVFACSHAGSVKQGWEYFVSTIQDHGLVPTLVHYVFMLDLLGRAGRLKEAEDLINNMPFQPDVVSCMSLLGACATHGNIDRGVRAMDQVFQLDPGNSAAHVLLSNMYSAAGMWDDVEKLKQRMESLLPKV